MGQTPKSVESGAVAKKPSADSGDEATGEGRRGGRRGEGGREGGGRGGRGNMFERFDANKDGKLSKDEIPERMQTRMEPMDTDKDGTISLKEFQDGSSRMFAPSPKGTTRQRVRTNSAVAPAATMAPTRQGDAVGSGESGSTCFGWRFFRCRCFCFSATYPPAV